MISIRLKQLRLARGLSLDELVAKTAGIVTKQAISKYEQGKNTPSPRVLTKLAAALGVKAAHLASAPSVQVEFVAYRKKSDLSKKDQTKVESLVTHCLEERIRLQDLIQDGSASNIPIQSLPVSNLDDAEDAAETLRSRWNLGRDPIGSLTGVLENNRVHVLPIDANEKFDGISAVAYGEHKIIRGAAVVIQRDTPGERQRLNLAHELGHLVLKIQSEVDEEKAAFRFGGAFLAPRELMFHEVGQKRSVIGTEELLLLKQRFGLSIQALLHRLKDLSIINDHCYVQWWKYISRRSWKKNEPNRLEPEKPEWLRQNVLRAFAEGVIGQEEAESMLGEKIEVEPPLSLTTKKSFMKLPLDERWRLMAEQANKLQSHYEEDPEVRGLGGGDFVE